MAYFAIGPVASSILTVRQVRFGAVVGDIEIPSGQQAVQADTLIGSGDPNSIVGRKLDITNQSAPSLIAISLAEQRPAWLARTGTAYTDGMDAARQWWPNEFTSAAEQNRALDVLTLELPNWWRTNAGILAQAITGRAWGTMTAEQIEACVAHYEGLLTLEFDATATLPRAIGIIKRWYDVGRSDSVSTNASNPRGTGRNVNNYGLASTYTLGYTDTFQVVSGILTPRTPDYQWLTLASFVAFPSNFDPENPA